jgi:hypothetical protein
MNYYTYYSYEEWGRGYIGCRPSGCDCDPEQDPYLGSYKDKSFNPTSKIILGVYETPEECLEAEIALHAFFEVDKNPHFANQARQTSTGFSMAGEGHYRYGNPLPEEVRAKISDSLRGKPTGRKCPQSAIDANRARAGIPHTEEVRAKISKARKGKGKGPKSEGHKKAMSRAKMGISKGKKWWNNGEKSFFNRECPEGCVPGRLPRR